MLFSWKKNKIKENIFFNKNNDDLILELKENGITDKDILTAIKKFHENYLLMKFLISGPMKTNHYQ